MIQAQELKEQICERERWFIKRKSVMFFLILEKYVYGLHNTEM